MKYTNNNACATISVATLVTLTGLTGSLSAESDWLSHERLGLGIQAGTQGVGPVLTYDVFSWLYVKAEGNFFSYSIDDVKIDDIDYSGDLDLFSAGLSLTARPLSKLPVLDGFKASAGIFAVNNQLSARAESSGQDVTINDETYILGEGDAVIAEAGFDSVAPYVGIGWDWTLGSEDQFTFSLEAGALFSGSPDVDFMVDDNTGLVSSSGNALTQADIDAELADLKDEVDVVTVYPVFKIGMLWNF